MRPLPNAAPLEAWLSPPQLERVRARLGAAKKPEAQRRARAELLSELPGLRTVVPALLDRGSPEGVRLALELCEHSDEPALLEALGRFARGERGHIRDRVRAAHALVVAGAAREEELALWTGRGRQPFSWFDTQVYDTPEHHHGARVTKLIERALLALQEGRGAQAEHLLQEGIALEPEAPDLRYNLVAAHQEQGRWAEAAREVEAVHERWPHYFFARCALSQMRSAGGQLEQARSLLEPLLPQRRMHLTEFRALCAAHADLLLAEGDRDAAAVWVALLEDVAPEDSQLFRLRMRLAPESLLSRMRPLLDSP